MPIRVKIHASPAIVKADEKTGNRTETIKLLAMTKHELIIDK